MVHKRIVAHKGFPQVDRFFLYAMMKASLYFSQQKSYPVFFIDGVQALSRSQTDHKTVKI